MDKRGGWDLYKWYDGWPEPHAWKNVSFHKADIPAHLTQIVKMWDIRTEGGSYIMSASKEELLQMRESRIIRNRCNYAIKQNGVSSSAVP